MEVVGHIFGMERSLLAEFSWCLCAAIRTRAAPVETRWPPRDIKLKLSSEQTNASLSGLWIWRGDNSFLCELGEFYAFPDCHWCWRQAHDRTHCSLRRQPNFIVGHPFYGSSVPVTRNLEATSHLCGTHVVAWHDSGHSGSKTSRHGAALRRGTVYA